MRWGGDSAAVWTEESGVSQVKSLSQVERERERERDGRAGKEVMQLKEGERNEGGEAWSGVWKAAFTSART